MQPMLLLAMIVVAALAQTTAPPHDKPDENSRSLCTVSGRVVTAADGTPLRSAHVALRPELSGPHPDVYGTTSDSDGGFIIKNVKPGRYEFLATHSGYVDQQYESQGTHDGAVLALKPGQEVTNIFFRLVMAAVVTGRVNDENGEPMVGTQVVALRKPSVEELDRFSPYRPELVSAGSGQTDDRGQYRIFALKPGEYYLRATESGEMPHGYVSFGSGYWFREWLGAQYAPVYYPGVLQPDQARAVPLRAGEEMQADFSMRRTKAVEIAGRVIGAGGGPATKVYVNLDQRGADDFADEVGAATDEDGRFRFKGVFPGSYIIKAYERREDGIYESHARQKVEVGNENIESIALVLSRGANLRGRISTAGLGSVDLERIRLELGPASGSEDIGAWCGVKKDGSFEFKNVEDGDYFFQLSGIDQGLYVKSVRLGSDDVLAKGIQVEKGAIAGNLEVIISTASAQLDGFVTIHDRPVIGSRVRVANDPETPYNRFRSDMVSTDQTGHFVVNDIAPGKYRVIADSPGSSDGAPVSSSDPQTVTLAEHDHQTMQIAIVPIEKQ
jgi:protocatechuate 3,4-dioxygenase beta subunit